MTAVLHRDPAETVAQLEELLGLELSGNRLSDGDPVARSVDHRHRPSSPSLIRPSPSTTSK